MSLGSKRRLPSSHHLGYMEATERRNYPYYIKLRYTPPNGLFGVFVPPPYDGCSATANLLSLDASLVIKTRVPHFEASGWRRRTSVRPVYPEDLEDRRSKDWWIVAPSCVE
jgi:hypothetical protein